MSGTSSGKKWDRRKLIQNIVSSATGLLVAADVNAVPPASLEGIGVQDDGKAIARSRALGIGALLFTLVYRDATFRETIRYSIQGLALMPIFYFAVRFSGNWLFRGLNSSWAVTLGVYSYAIYLIHFVVIWVFITSLPSIAHPPSIVLPATLAISIAYAAAIDRFVDPYFRRLRHAFRTVGFDRRQPSRRQPSRRPDSEQIAAE